MIYAHLLSVIRSGRNSSYKTPVEGWGQRADDDDMCPLRDVNSTVTGGMGTHLQKATTGSRPSRGLKQQLNNQCGNGVDDD